MQFINVEVFYIDSGVGPDGIYQFPAIPQIGSEIAIEDDDFKVVGITYYPLSASSPPRRSYVTLYVERMK